MKVVLDTNVLVAACEADHEHHARALPVVETVHEGHAEGFVSALVLKRIYPAQSIPVPIWYGAAFVQWLCLGVLVDLLRRVLRRRVRI